MSTANTNTKNSSAIISIKSDGNPFQSNLTQTTLSSTSPITSHLNLIQQNWLNSNSKGKPFETRIFYGPNTLTTTISLGQISNQSLSDVQKSEQTRKSLAIAAKSIKDHATEVLVDPIWSSHSAAVGVTLSTFSYLYKPLIDQPPQLSNEKASDQLIELNWSSGLIFGQAQNLARELMETPANMMTPTAFCDRIKHEFDGIPNVEIHVCDSFLSVARGSNEPCKFLEGAGGFQPSVAFVGKGITFDSGGISLKPGAGMKLMRADMGGAACVNSAAWAIAKLQIPIDLIVCTPLTENMPSGHATKPGDIIYAMNGKSIEVDNTDAEGRLVLADALYYASSVYKPRTVIDCATLTGAMVIALGESFSGVFSTSDKLWNDLDAAGKAEHDRFWRMPFDDTYMSQIDGTNADLCNTGGRSAGSCTAAIFLREFVDGLACNATATEGQDKPTEDTIAYAHLDIAGSMECTKPEGYNLKGMSGRPVRALIEYVRQEAASRT
ncbi:cytosol aminopeptidase family, catalytic domain-containing protein [Melampsora americana]|nr:cytosol aminopeptidase family, catalytic domain-containing protein [Melampsora americana]